jgi:hypothetical protein
MGGNVANNSFMRVLMDEGVSGVDIDNRIQAKAYCNPLSTLPKQLSSPPARPQTRPPTDS